MAHKYIAIVLTVYPRQRADIRVSCVFSGLRITLYNARLYVGVFLVQLVLCFYPTHPTHAASRNPSSLSPFPTSLSLSLSLSSLMPLVQDMSVIKPENEQTASRENGNSDAVSQERDRVKEERERESAQF